MFETWLYGNKLIFIKKGQKYGFIIGIDGDVISTPFSKKSGFKLTEKSSSYIYQLLPSTPGPGWSWQEINKTIFDFDFEINLFEKFIQEKLISYVFEGIDID